MPALCSDHLIGVLVQVLDVLLPIQLPASGQQKQWKVVRVLGRLTPMCQIQMKLLPLA